MSQPIFDVVPEDPQVPHVTDQMEPTTVQEHGRQIGNGD